MVTTGLSSGTCLLPLMIKNAFGARELAESIPQPIAAWGAWCRWGRPRSFYYNAIRLHCGIGVNGDRRAREQNEIEFASEDQQVRRQTADQTR